MVRFLVAAFALALAGLLGWLAYFASTSGGALERFGVLGALWITAGFAGAVSLTSGLLAYHYKFEGYTRGEEVIFCSCLIVSTGILLCSGIWGIAIVVFG